MINNDTLRLLSEFNYYITSEGWIMFSETSKKCLELGVKRYLKRFGYNLVTSGTILDNHGFKVKYKDGFLKVSHPSIYSGKYFDLLRGSESNITDICGYSEIHGEDIQEEFELAVYQDEDAPVTYFIHPGMPQYQIAWEGFVNQVNLMVHKKTKKLQAGHRYSIGDISIVYLGETSGPQEMSDPKGKIETYHAFIRGTDRNISTIQEAISNLDRCEVLDKLPKYFYYNQNHDTLFLVKKTGYMVDLGEALSDDRSGKDFIDFWPDFIRNQKVSEDNESFGESIGVDGLSRLVDLICCTSNGESGFIKYEIENKGLIENQFGDIVKRVFLNDIIIYNMDRPSYDDTMELKLSNPDDKNIEAAKKNFDNNARFKEPGKLFHLLSRLGISLDDIIKDCLITYKNLDLTGNFENFYKYNYRFLCSGDRNYQRSISITSPNRDPSVEYSDSGQLRKLFKSKEIQDTIIEMLYLAKENLGLVSDFFDYLGVYQYRSKNVRDINVKIGLKKLVEYLGGLNTLTESIKSDLLSEKFVSLDVNFEQTTIFE